MSEDNYVVTLEDGIEYVVVNELSEDENTYVYLTNIDDETDFCIRKLINNQLIGLNNTDEFKRALLLYTKRCI